MKKYIGLFAAASVLAFASAVNAQQIISVTVEGVPLVTDTPAQIVNGRTLVPMRAIFETLGAQVGWDQETKTVNASKNGVNIEMQIGASGFYVNGNEIALDTPAQIIDGRTMVPVRAVSESLGCKVDWDSESKTVIISTNAVSATETKTVESVIVEKETEETTEAFVPDTKHIASISSKMSRPKVFDTSYTENDWFDVHSGVRYYFEQSAIKEVFYSDVKNAAEQIKDTEKFKKYIKDIWESNYELLFTQAGAEEDAIPGYIEKADLSFDRNVNVYTAELEKGIDIGIISVANDHGDDVCAYIMPVVYADNLGEIYMLVYNEEKKGYVPWYVGPETIGKYDTVISEKDTETPQKFIEYINTIMHS